MYIQGNKKCEYEEGCEGGRRGRKGASSQELKMAVTPAVRVMPVNLCPNDRIHTGSGLGERRKKRRRKGDEEEGGGCKKGMEKEVEEG